MCDQTIYSIYTPTPHLPLHLFCPSNVLITVLIAPFKLKISVHRFSFRCGIRMLELANDGGELCEPFNRLGYQNRIRSQLASALKNLGVVYMETTEKWKVARRVVERAAEMFATLPGDGKGHVRKMLDIEKTLLSMYAYFGGQDLTKFKRMAESMAVLDPTNDVRIYTT